MYVCMYLGGGGYFGGGGGGTMPSISAKEEAYIHTYIHSVCSTLSPLGLLGLHMCSFRSYRTMYVCMAMACSQEGYQVGLDRPAHAGW